MHNYNNIQIEICKELKKNGQINKRMDKALDEYVTSGRAEMFRLFMEGNFAELSVVANRVSVKKYLESMGADEETIAEVDKFG